MSKGGVDDHEQQSIDLIDFDTNGNAFVDLA